MRVCTNCAFEKDASQYTGKHGQCLDCRRAKVRAYYKAHRTAVLAQKQAYYDANRDAILANRRAKHWYGHDVIRYARLCGASTVERVSRASIWERDGGRCHICGKRADPRRWHLDHLVPLSRGGTHTALNVAVAHPRCNQRRWVTGPAQLRLEAGVL